jgi:serine/threonine-protein phosphatase 6 regulatory ankyrin repeat subunit B
MEASWNRHIDMVRLLLKAGANINLTDERDYTALMQAAEEGHHNIVQVLIEAGCDLNKQEKKRNYTALMWSVVEGHPSVVQFLVQAGSDLNIQDKYGFTALMQAARTRFLAAVLLLVGNGADLEIKDKKNRTVYDLGNQQVLQAIEKGKRELRRKYMTVFASDRGLSQLPPDTHNIIGNYLVTNV